MICLLIDNYYLQIESIEFHGMTSNYWTFNIDKNGFEWSGSSSNLEWVRRSGCIRFDLIFVHPESLPKEKKIPITAVNTLYHFHASYSLLHWSMWTEVSFSIQMCQLLFIVESFGINGFLLDMNWIKPIAIIPHPNHYYYLSF